MSEKLRETQHDYFALSANYQRERNGVTIRHSASWSATRPTFSNKRDEWDTFLQVIDELRGSFLADGM